MKFRTLARAGALSLAAAALASCGDSTGPLNLEPDQLEAIGESIAFEIEGSVMQLTPSGVMGDAGGAAASRSARRTPSLAGASFSIGRSEIGSPAAQVVDADCGVPSQNPPTDTDQDGVPNNLSITYSLPACAIEGQDGSIEITGVFRISDPLPTTPAMALTFALDNLRFAFDGVDADGFVMRDGSSTVSVSATGLSQTQDWMEVAQISGFPRITVDLDWTASFVAAPGQTITGGQPLPDGEYEPGGSVIYREGNRQSSLSVTTEEPLQYSAECAAGVAEGLVDAPFTAGIVRLAFSGQQGSGFVRITYTDCGFAVVQYVALN